MIEQITGNSEVNFPIADDPLPTDFDCSAFVWDCLTAAFRWGVRRAAQDPEISGLCEEDSFGDPPRSKVFKWTAEGTPD